MATGPREPVSVCSPAESLTLSLSLSFLSTFLVFLPVASILASLSLFFSFPFQFCILLRSPFFPSSPLSSPLGCSLARSRRYLNFFTSMKGGNGIKWKKGGKKSERRLHRRRVRRSRPFADVVFTGDEGTISFFSRDDRTILNIVFYISQHSIDLRSEPDESTQFYILTVGLKNCALLINLILFNLFLIVHLIFHAYQTQWVSQTPNWLTS